MATYFYVEMAECYTPPTKSKAKLPSQVSVSPDCGSQEAPASPPWSLSTDKTAFVMRVPNDSIIRLFSLLVNIVTARHRQPAWYFSREDGVWLRP